MANYRFFKLGEKSEVFFDPVSRLKVSPGNPGSIEKIKVNNRIENARASRHLEEITKKEYDSFFSNSDKKEPESGFDNHPLMEYNKNELDEIGENQLSEEKAVELRNTNRKRDKVEFLVANGIEEAEEGEEEEEEEEEETEENKE